MAGSCGARVMLKKLMVEVLSDFECGGDVNETIKRTDT